MKNILHSLTVIMVFPAILSCSSELGELDGSYKEKKLIMTHGMNDFSADKWADASSQLRGTMVRSLFMKHKFIGKQTKYIDDLLGYYTCYIDYDDQPCYELIYDETYYFLVFYVKHSGNIGEITNINFLARE